jgi:HSP20 family protein
VNRRSRAFRLLQIQGKLGDVAYEMTRVNFLRFHPVETRWQPAVNIFLCPRCFRISADLAGVDPDEVELSVSNGRLLISGDRPAPEPPCGEEEIEVARTKAVRVLAMEIDYGAFAREIVLPDGVDLDRVKTEWNNGILWIEIPRRSQA